MSEGCFNFSAFATGLQRTEGASDQALPAASGDTASPSWVDLCNALWDALAMARGADALLLRLSRDGVITEDEALTPSRVFAVACSKVFDVAVQLGDLPERHRLSSLADELDDAFALVQAAGAHVGELVMRGRVSDLAAQPVLRVLRVSGEFVTRVRSAMADAVGPKSPVFSPAAAEGRTNE